MWCWVSFARAFLLGSREANINIKDKGLRYTDPGQIQVSAFYPIVIRHPPEDEDVEADARIL